MSKCALPKHLQDKIHNDWPWPLSHVSRGFNAAGPRCGAGRDGYKSWPPKLIKGRGVCRWESSGAQSIIYIPEFDGVDIDGSIVYGSRVKALEVNPGHANYGTYKMVELNWVESIHSDGSFFPQQYSPSAIQYFSKSGHMQLSPNYYSTWRAFDFKDVDGVGRWSKGFFYRWGWRPDHLDVYYNWGPFVGLRGE